MSAGSGDISGYDFFLLFMGIVGIFILIAIINGYKEKNRCKEISDYCLKNGLEYSEKAKNVPEMVKQLSLTKDKGTTNEWIVEMSGKGEDCNFTIFEHYSERRQAKSIHTQIDSICVLFAENMNLPHFYLRDEGKLYDSLEKMLGGQDINFSEDRDFSNKFVLQGLEEQAIRSFFDRKIRQAFVNKHIKGYMYEGRSNYFVIALPYRVLNLSERLELLTNATNIFKDLIPRDNKEEKLS